MPFSPELPAPPVPADCNLRGLPYYPLNYQRLVGSSFHRLATAAEWRAGLLLWMKSWHEIPAGSLPGDDRELCVLAEVPMRAWLKLKDMALHGWVLHSDGRLYHPVVTEVTLHAWGQREANRHRTTAALQARQRRQRDVERDVERDVGRDVNRNVHQVKEEVEVPPPPTPEPNGSVVVAPPPTDVARPPQRGSRLPQEICLSDDWIAAAEAARSRANLPPIDLATEFEKFCNYWLDKTGKDATKVGWRRTWVNWALNAKTPRNGNGAGTPLANLFEGAWRAANERERREQERDRGTDRGPVDPLLEQH